MQDKQNNINVEPFINKINAYVFKFMDRSITGKLTGKNGDYILIEMKSGGIICAHIDTLLSIWHIQEKHKAVV
jgi:hypothetical protein